jgi:hypothetical protein
MSPPLLSFRNGIFGGQIVNSQHNRLPDLADSSLKCNGDVTRVQLLHKDLVRCFETEVFSGSVVKAVHG